MTINAEVEPAPVFVDQTGRRGRRLRGLGWVVGVTCTAFAVAMGSGLVGAQSEAPPLSVPNSADTTPPSRFIDAPPPVPPQGPRPIAKKPTKTSPTKTRPTTTQPTKSHSTKLPTKSGSPAAHRR